MFFETQRLERTIHDCLVNVRQQGYDHISTFNLYSWVTQLIPSTTVAQFNKAIGDMKKVGMVGVSNGKGAHESYVRLTDAAWECYQRQQAQESGKAGA